MNDNTITLDVQVMAYLKGLTQHLLDGGGRGGAEMRQREIEKHTNLTDEAQCNITARNRWWRCHMRNRTEHIPGK